MQAVDLGASAGSLDHPAGGDLPVRTVTDGGSEPFVERVYRHRTFFSRLHHFVRLSSAFIVVRGGIGTTLETMMVWQLCQVRHIRTVPLIFVGEMWEDLVEWAKHHMLKGDPKLASAEDLEIPHCVATVEEACAIVERDLAAFNGA